MEIQSVIYSVLLPDKGLENSHQTTLYYYYKRAIHRVIMWIALKHVCQTLKDNGILVLENCNDGARQARMPPRQRGLRGRSLHSRWAQLGGVALVHQIGS